MPDSRATAFTRDEILREKQKRDFVEDYSDRADGSPAGYISTVLHTPTKRSTDRELARLEQKYRKSNSKESRAENTQSNSVSVDPSVLDKFFK